jgi:heme A synthase
MPLTRFARFSWAVVAYNLAVILWGAFVRASGSGAGCGRHWPMCNGEVIPREPRVATLIELFHRVTSGVALILVLVLAVWAVRAYPKGSVVRKGAFFGLGFTLGEALLGAGLVLFELVAHDASMKRALSMALHLTNTFFLLGALTLTAWWASGGARVRLRRQGPMVWIFAPVFLGMLLLGTSGAIAALGDTLFPAHTWAEGLAQDRSTTAHVFLRLRLLHPFIAALTGVTVIAAAFASRHLRPAAAVKRASRVVTVAFLAQLGAGLANLALLAPIWMQLTHLLLADVVWIALVVLAAASLADSEANVAVPVAAPGLADQRPA